MNMVFGGRDLRELFGGAGDMAEALHAVQVMRATLQQREAELRAVREQLRALRAEQQAKAETEASPAQEDERAKMQQEDERSRLRVLVDACGRELARLKRANDARTQRELSRDGSGEASEAPEGSEEEQQGVGCKAEEGDAGNQESHEDWDADEVLGEMVQEKLQLLAQLHRFKEEVENQTSTLLEERAKFAETKEDLELSLEEAEQRIAEMEGREAELASEKQFAEEKYDFLHTELDMLRQDQSQLKLKLHKAEDAAFELQHVLDEERATHQLEVISLRTTHQAEREQLLKAVEDLKAKAKAELAGPTASSASSSGLQEIEQELAAIANNMVDRESEIAKLHEEVDRLNEALYSAQHCDDQSMEALEKKLESFSQTSMILKEQLGEKEEEVAKLRVNLRDQDKALQASTSRCDDLEKALQDLTREHEECASTMKERAEAAQKEITSARALIDKQKVDNEELEVTQSALSAKLVATNEEIRAVKDECTAVLSELNSSQSQCRDLESELSLKTVELNEASAKSEQAQALLQALERQMADDQATHKALVRKLSDTQTRMAAQEKVHLQQMENLAMEKTVLQEEMQQLKDSLRAMQEDLATQQSNVVVLTQQQQAHQLETDTISAQLLSTRRQLEASERSLMQIEDYRSSSRTKPGCLDHYRSSTQTWTTVAQGISALGKFLPALQTTTVLLDDALCACEENTAALSVICPQLEHDSSSSLLSDVLFFKEFAQQLKDMVTTNLPGSSRQVRRFHRQVFEMLSHWYEVTDLDEVPAPPFTIASREVAHVLSNWTSNKALRESTLQWLEYVEGIGSSTPVSTQLRTEGITRLLKNLSIEVKQGFLMMILPILRRNPCVFIRVFTRLVSPSGDSSFVTMDARRWEMKIHIQPVSRSTSFAVASSVPDYAGFELPPPSPSSVSSISSATSSTTSSRSARLQIIQERLQSMQSR